MVAFTSIVAIASAAAADRPETARSSGGDGTSIVVAPDTVQLAQADLGTDGRRSFNIPTQDLSSALTLFGRQAGLQVAADTELLAGLRTQGVRGDLIPDQALDRLLAGTGLSYRYTGDRAIALERNSPESGGGPNQLQPIVVQGARAGSGGYTPPPTTNIGIDPFGGPLKETPATVNVIPRQFIEDRAPRNARDLADFIPGVNNIETNGGTGQNFSIRGFTTNDSGSLNGQRQRVFNNQTRGFANIERIEVLKGSAGVETGVVEPGGVLNFVTKKPQAERAFVVSGDAGSFDRYGAVFDATGPLTSDREVLYRFIAEARTENSFRDNFDQDRVLLAPSLQWDYAPGSSALLELEYIYQDQAYDRGTFYLEGAGLEDDFAPIEFSAHEPDDSLKSHWGRASLYLSHRLDDVFSLRGAATYAIEDYLSEGARNPDLRPLYIPGTNSFSGNSTIERSFTRFDGENEQFLSEAEGLAEFSTGAFDHGVLLGLAWSWAENDNAGQDGQTVWPLDAFDPVYGTDPVVIGAAEDGVGRDFISFSNETHRSIYTQYKLTAWDRLHLLGGVRYDDADFDSQFTANINTDPTGPKTTFGDTVISYRVGAAFDVTDAVTVFGGFSNASEPQGGQDRDGNGFEPLESVSVDAGLKVDLFNAGALLTASVFNITQTNLAEPDPDNLPGELFEELIGEVRSRGVEVELTGAITDHFDVFAGAAYLDTEITSSTSGQEGNRLYSVPEWEASLWGRYDFSELLLQGLSAGLGVVYVGEREGDNDNSFELPAYTRIDASVFYQWRDVRLGLRAENLLDETYFLGSQNRAENITPGAPFNIIASLSWTF